MRSACNYMDNCKSWLAAGCKIGEKQSSKKTEAGLKKRKNVSNKELCVEDIV